MKVCVVGGGAAGLYAAKSLLRNGHTVNLFESGRIFGKIMTHFLPEKKHRYLSAFQDVFKNRNFHFFNKEVKSLKDLDCDAFVVATGALPKQSLLRHAISADRVIRWYNQYGKDNLRLGRHVCLVGMGDVSLDIAKFLASPDMKAASVEKISILSRKNPFLANFTNLQMRDVVESSKVRLNCDVFKCFRDFRNILSSAGKKSTGSILASAQRRLKILGNLKKNGRVAVSLLFNCFPLKIETEGSGLKLYYIHGDKTRTIRADTVISSTGYEPRDNSLLVEGVRKPIFYVGACKEAKGDIANIKAQAEVIAEEITKM